MLDVARTGLPRGRGVGRLRSVPYRGEGDLDVDASLDTLVAARAGDRPPEAEDLVARSWARPELALCVAVDRSGSMGGEPLAAASVAAAVCALRAPDDHSVLTFADKVVVVQAQDEARPAPAVVEDVLRLRGAGTTDLALVMRAAATQLGRSRARRRVLLLLSDCRRTAGEDPVPVARGLDEVCVVAPADDDEDARAFAAALGGRLAVIGGPSDVPRALGEVLGP